MKLLARYIKKKYTVLHKGLLSDSRKSFYGGKDMRKTPLWLYQLSATCTCRKQMRKPAFSRKTGVCASECPAPTEKAPERRDRPSVLTADATTLSPPSSPAHRTVQGEGRASCIVGHSGGPTLNSAAPRQSSPKSAGPETADRQGNVFSKSRLTWGEDGWVRVEN